MNQEIRVSRQKIICRVFLYFLGMIMVSVGIVLCVKCELGISPISSIPYVLSFLTPMSFGTATMLLHLVNTLFQYIMERKRVNIKVFLQIPVAVVFGLIIDLVKALMSFDAESLLFKIVLMCLSVVFTAMGMHFMLSMKLVQNPPDGTVKLIAEKRNRETGTVKVVYDITMVVISAVISLAAFHTVIGFGVATIVSAIFVGKTLTVCKKIVHLDGFA